MTEYYPEIVDANGLALLLRRELAARHPSAVAESITITTPGSPYWAIVSVGDRTAQVTTGKVERVYLCSYWESDVLLLEQKVTELPPLVAALEAWLVDRLRASTLADKVAGARLADGALAYEAGATAYIADRWVEMCARLSQEAARGRGTAAGLLPVAERAAAHPVLGRLLPYCSLGRLSVSNGLAPSVGEYPLIHAARDQPGRFMLTDYEGRILGEGNAETVVAVLADRVETTRAE